MLDELRNKLTDKMVVLHEWDSYLIDNKQLKREVAILDLYHSIYTWVREDQWEDYSTKLKALLW